MSPRDPLSIEWAQSAWEDLDGITDYLRDEGLAFEDVEEYVKRLYTAPAHLSRLLGAGKPGRMPSTREWLVKGTPYALIYHVSSDSVQILRVMHGSRQCSEQCQGR